MAKFKDAKSGLKYSKEPIGAVFKFGRENRTFVKFLDINRAMLNGRVEHRPTFFRPVTLNSLLYQFLDATQAIYF